MPTEPLDARMRDATAADVPRIVELLASDPLGARRERPGEPLDPGYAAAFAAIDADANQELVVAEVAGRIVGVQQITFIPSMTYRGGWRAQVEGVRVDESVRSRGLGRTMLGYAIDRARKRGCRMLQLTTDRQRPEARRFYESLGFVASHEGMKLHLVEPAEARPEA